MDSIVSSSSMEMSVESKTNAWLNKTNQDQQQQRDHDQQREHSELKLKKLQQILTFSKQPKNDIFGLEMIIILIHFFSTFIRS